MYKVQSVLTVQLCAASAGLVLHSLWYFSKVYHHSTGPAKCHPGHTGSKGAGTLLYGSERTGSGLGAAKLGIAGCCCRGIAFEGNIAARGVLVARRPLSSM